MKTTTAAPVSNSRRNLIVIGTLVTLAAAGGVWAWVARAPRTPELQIPAEYSADALKAKAETNPGEVFDSMRAAMDRKDLTDEQRDAIRDNMRKVMEEQMDKRLDEFFTASTDDEKKVVLDRHIDEWERMRKEREAKEADRPPPTQEERDRWRRAREGRTPPTQAERKSRSESRNPDQMARRMAYFQAMQNRMKERGIQTPGFGPGGRGMGGRGPGGGPRG